MNDLLAAWQPSAQDPFDLPKVGHLLRRAGFGAALAVRNELVRAGVAAAIDHVCKAEREPAVAESLLQEAIAFGDTERIFAFRVWLALQCAQPLRERLAVFWHGHFATSDRKVQDSRAMALQFATFDRLSLGRFDELLAAMCHDPALLRWLDNDSNRKGQPNENFARELFELFALGRGNYTEQDIREAARAFSGWHVRDGRFFFAAWQHDGGDKQVLGARGPLTGDDVAELCAKSPDSARFLAAKWLRCFVHPEPEPAEIEALAAVYQDHDRDILRTLRTLLSSRLFFSPRAYRSKVKSPAEFAIGTVRLCGGRAQPTFLARTMRALGEAWLEPPSVEGWHGERVWLSPASWLLRSNFVADLFGLRQGKFEPRPGVLFRGLQKPEQRARAAELLLLDGRLCAAGRDRLLAVARAGTGDDDRDAATLLHAGACLPEYQLL